MSSEQQVEADLLTLASEQFRDGGYTFIVEPTGASLPKELRPLHPDAIAIGKLPFFVIEVVREGSKYAERIDLIQRALSDLTEWKLYLIVDRSDQPTGLAASSLHAVREVLSNVKRISEFETKGALILAWACLEALARILEPHKFLKPQTPGRIVETLASLAYLAPSQAGVLRALAKKRNAVVHGELGAQVTETEIRQFYDILQELRRTAARRKRGSGEVV